jgi:hypothetical protein
MGGLADAFYLLADLEGPIRSNSRAPCYFFIDPSIEPDSIARIQFSNLVFDLFGIHKNVQIETAGTIQYAERFFIPGCSKSYLSRVFPGRRQNRVLLPHAAEFQCPTEA